MGSAWVLSAQDGPHIGPMSLAIRDSQMPIYICPCFALISFCHLFNNGNEHTLHLNCDALIINPMSSETTHQDSDHYLQHYMVSVCKPLPVTQHRLGNSVRTKLQSWAILNHSYRWLLPFKFCEETPGAKTTPWPFLFHVFHTGSLLPKPSPANQVAMVGIMILLCQFGRWSF